MSSNPPSPNWRLPSPNKPNIIQIATDVYRIVHDEVSSSLILNKIKPNPIEFQIICGTFYMDSDLTTQFKGTKLAIYANNVVVRDSYKIDLSGVPHNQFNNDAGQFPDGTGQDGRNGTAGESGGNFVLICKTIKFENDSNLLIMSNGANGMNGQNGGKGNNGRNGRDATEHSFQMKNFDFRIYTALCAENREMFEKFGLQSLQNRTSYSKVTTDDGLTGHVFVQPYNNKVHGLMLVKGEELELPGKLGGRGGLGGQEGFPGNIHIRIGQEKHHENIITINYSGVAGQDGIGGLNGLNGRIGSDFLKYHCTDMQDDPVCFCHDAPTKFKLQWGEPRDCSLYDTEKCQYVCAVEDYKIPVPSTERTRNDAKKTEKTREKAYQKPSIDINDIVDEYSKYLQDLEEETFHKSIVQKIKNRLSKTNH